MKHAVGDKVTLKTTQKHWNGIRAVVTRAGSDDPRYPYDVRLLEDSHSTAYKKGEVAEAFREDELVPTAESLAADIEEAKALLRKHGLAFRIYTREDVDKMLDLYAEDLHEPLDTSTFREELADFIMEGQDWRKLAQKGLDDEIVLWGLVEGARNDHPEWFVA